MVFSSEAKVTRSKFLPTTFPLFYATSTPTITYTAAVPQKDHDSLNQVCTTYASSFFLTECHSVLYNTMNLLPNSFVGKFTFLTIDAITYTYIQLFCICNTQSMYQLIDGANISLDPSFIELQNFKFEHTSNSSFIKLSLSLDTNLPSFGTNLLSISSFIEFEFA